MMLEELQSRLRSPPTFAASPSEGEEMFLPINSASFWISERAFDSREPLIKGEPYTGDFRIGSPVPASLIPDEQAIIQIIPSSDVPPEGLQTSWVIATSSIEFESMDASTVVNRKNEAAEGNASLRFSLTIPQLDSPNIAKLPAQYGVCLQMKWRICKDLPMVPSQCLQLGPPSPCVLLVFHSVI